MSADRATYLDSSALVKLAVREPESVALRRYLRRRRPLIASALVRTEVTRAMLPAELRPLDAIHLATAHQLGADLARIVTYDDGWLWRPTSSACRSRGQPDRAPAGKAYVPHLGPALERPGSGAPVRESPG